MDICAERSERKRSDVTTTNPVYRCEELEDNASLYDEISEENVSTAEHVEKPDSDYLEILSDEIEQRYQGPELPLPRPEPEKKSHSQDREYENLKEEEPNSKHVYLEILSDEIDQRTKPQLPTQQPVQIQYEDRDHDCEGAKDSNPDHQFFLSLSNETQGCDQHIKAENKVQDSEAQDRHTKTSEQNQEKDTKCQDQGQDNPVETTTLDDAKQISLD